MDYTYEQLKDYAEYVEAKIEIDEMPLLIADHFAFSKLFEN